MTGVRAELGLAADDVIAAERLIRAGDACRSSTLFAQGDERLAAALDSIDRQLADARARVGSAPVRTASGPAATAVDTAGDVSESDMLVVGLEYWREQVVGIRAWNRQGAAAFAAVCDASTIGTTRGVIKAVLDAERRIILRDGRSFVLAEPIVPAGDLFPTRAVQLGGLMFADGNGYATAVGPEGPGIVLPPSALIPCLKLRFAPVQRLPPIFAGPFVLHDPLGYKAAGVYNVESGMAVAAESNCSPGKGRSFPRYTLKVEISYQQKQTGAAIDHAIMAPELEASDAPVLFSTDIDPNVAATLHVTSQVQTCLPTKSSPQCTDPTGIEVDYPLMVRWRGALASASYEQTEFDVNDQISGDFRLTHLSSFTALANVDDGTSQMFVAEGYGPFFDGVAETPIVNTDPFAIRNTDFVPIFPAFTLAEAVNDQQAASLSGVDHPAGLRWPRVQGIRNGREFWYSASLPSITRDVVNFCESPNAYYRLPFRPESQLGPGAGQPSGTAVRHPGLHALGRVCLRHDRTAGRVDSRRARGPCGQGQRVEHTAVFPERRMSTEQCLHQAPGRVHRGVRAHAPRRCDS